jgi:hypothetical protein
MIALIVVLAVVGVLGAAVAAFLSLGSRLRSGQGIGASFRSVLVAYFYAMSVASLVVFAVGMTSLVKVGLAEMFGRGFSYYVPTAIAILKPPVAVDGGQVQPAPVPDPAAEQQQAAQVERQMRSDLVQGASLAVAGALIWALHAWGRRRIAGAADELSTFLAKSHLIVLLLLFGLGGIISLVTGVYQSLTFALVPIDAFSAPQPPGEAAATALVLVPAWLILLAVALAELRRERR